MLRIAAAINAKLFSNSYKVKILLKIKVSFNDNSTAVLINRVGVNRVGRRFKSVSVSESIIRGEFPAVLPSIVCTRAQ